MKDKAHKDLEFISKVIGLEKETQNLREYIEFLEKTISQYEGNCTVYKLDTVSQQLMISKDALVDVRNALGIKRIGESELTRIKKTVDDIKRRYGMCTLSTINRYCEWMGIRNQVEC